MAMGAHIKVGSPEWASFEDWLHSILGMYEDWTIIADLRRYFVDGDKSFTERIAILSYLARNERGIITKAFEYDGWDTQYHQGSVDIEELDTGIVCKEDLGDEAARVFITRREEIGDYPAMWRLWPTFENYFNLRYDDSGNLIDPYKGDVVAEIPYPADNGPVCVRTDYIQEYLAARKMVLIRQHDHIRHWPKYIEGLPELEAEGSVHKEKWGCYRLDITNSKVNDIQRFSRLTAKDIVTPYERAGTVGGIRQAKVPIEDLPEFITSKGLDGKEMKMKPNPRDILYPTFFDPKVLKRYYDEPSRYTVGFHAPRMGGVSFLDEWSIPIGRNEEGLIIVWLGDLAKQGLPYEEIVHWRVYNVAPRGGMAMDFWNAQMMCKPPDRQSLERRLCDCRYLIRKAEGLKGRKIYRDYEGPDKHLEKTLRVPLHDEHIEFSEPVLILSKIFIEYLDHKGFLRDLPDELRNDKEGQPFGPIVLFSIWLENVIGTSKETADCMKTALQRIQMVRSKIGTAHRFSDNAYQEILEKLGLSGSITAKKLFSTIAEPLADALERICIELGSEDKLWWRKVTN